MAVDVERIQSNPDQPGQHIANIYLLGRWQPVRSFPVAVDCTGHRRAALVEGADFDASGSVAGAAWTDVPDTDPVLAATCARG